MQYRFTIKVLEIQGLPNTYGDVFCQFKFYNNSLANKANILNSSVLGSQ